MEREKGEVETALQHLGDAFGKLRWDFRPDPAGRPDDLVSRWPGNPEADVMLCAFKGTRIHERFHRQDFFFLNFAYRGDYTALSAKYDNRLAVREGDCYIGQPYSGYALLHEGGREVVILGVLIKKEAFFQDYFHSLEADTSLYRFFLEPQTNQYSDEFLHLVFPKDALIWPLLDLMVLTYDRREDDISVQRELSPLVNALMVFLSRQYHAQYGAGEDHSLASQIARYVEAHSDTATLRSVASHFGYNPNYISMLLPAKTGKTFSRTVTDARMAKAVLLLKNTTLPIEEIAALLGYGTTSNFYRAFRRYWHQSPRMYLKISH